MSDGAPWAAKWILPERSPSFITLGPATFAHLAFRPARPTACPCFSMSPSRSITMSGRKLTPYCCATVISATSECAGFPDPSRTAMKPKKNVRMRSSSQSAAANRTFSRAGFARLRAVAIRAGRAAAESKIHQKGDRRNARRQHQDCFYKAHLVGVTAHTQQIGEHEPRIGDDEESDQLPRQVAGVHAFHHEHGAGVKQNRIDEEIQEPQRERIC